ncbi:hypothetical protein HN695_01240 [Candidatus Woesearchaeota archaeon]|jgi:hypothetical protein|nr:hypothetical protein [Candidatus Woesearchaeota archaeon]MBT5273025.1 hypothetical protein [Candidatus Woesearchaeota archaeon]MBT6040839.1 hypothetical protein [Candidatus Woesearchaeota archaeon]MBT6336728.1 hypothetical protein [Candidatus Woesearchaeota archaeon]MBT7926939.1 hypothetical protein [Candidatus Woesearchaeota archaeon]
MEEEKIIIRTIITMIGKPKEHLDKILKDYVEELKKEEGVIVLKSDFAEAKEEPEKKNFFNAFVELELEFTNIDKLMWFCFDFMPTSIEIISPDKFVYNAQDFTNYLNEIQSKLHRLDMLIKNFEGENKVLKTNGFTLITNLINLILRINPSKIEEISQKAGIPAEQIKVFLENMVKDGRLKLENDVYSHAMPEN